MHLRVGCAELGNLTLDAGSIQPPVMPDNARPLMNVALATQLCNGTQVHHAQHITHFARGSAGVGLSRNAASGHWTGETIVAPCNGRLDIDLWQGTFAQETLDVNGDGRFNVLDREALFSRIGSTTPADLEFFDFNRSGTIDTADVALLDRLLASGLGQGSSATSTATAP